MEKLPIEPKRSYTLSDYVLQEGPYKGRSLEDILYYDPLYLQSLIEDGIYIPSDTMRRSTLANAKAILDKLVMIDDPEQYETD